MATPVATWRPISTYALLVRNNAAVLPRPIDDENFDFYGSTLNGQPQQRERWKRAVRSLDNALGEAVGQLYVQRHFPPEAKAQMLELVENLRRAYGERIDQLPWMSRRDQGRRAREAARIPSEDRLSGSLEATIPTLEVRAGDAFGNAQARPVFEYGSRSPRDWTSAPTATNGS